MQILRISHTYILFQTGYNDLKDLLPSNSSFVGCKTTNAAILFRAADYVKQLNEEIKKDEEEFSKLQTQLSALELIAQQYESFSSSNEPDSPLQVEMMKKFLDSCFESFSTTFDDKDYPTITKTLLSWIESMNLKVNLFSSIARTTVFTLYSFQKPAQDMLSVAKK